jgi:predicted AAA+ superfamily ATPase
MITKNDILETLSEWNFWNRALPETFARETYESDALQKSSTGEIVIVKGVRRCGKSTILINLIKRLIKDGVDPKEVLFVNLEDPKFINDLNTDLLSLIRDTYLENLEPGETPFLFLDEVQNIKGFEKWLVKAYELKTSKIFITGSNASLLSREIGSALSGRYLDVTVFPLDFTEFLAFNGLTIHNRLEYLKHRLKINRLFEDYLRYGGFPRVALIDDPELKKAELKAYFDSIILRDIVARYRLDNVEALMRLSVYLLSNISHLVSLNALVNHFHLSYDLINRYMEYLENAYLVLRVSKFDWSLKKQQVNPKKIYAIDTGLSNIASFNAGQKYGDRIENLVCLELIRRKKELFYYRTAGDLEVDFIVQENGQITTLIQVSAGIDDEKTRSREIRALVKAKNELKHARNAQLILLVPDVNELV